MKNIIFFFFHSSGLSSRGVGATKNSVDGNEPIHTVTPELFRIHMANSLDKSSNVPWVRE